MTLTAAPDEVMPPMTDQADDKNLIEIRSQYRTRPDDVRRDLPDKQAAITLPGYTNGCSLNPEGSAFIAFLSEGELEELPLCKNIQFCGKAPISENTAMDLVSECMLPTDDVNMSFLRYLYTIILQDHQRLGQHNIEIGHNIKIFIPDLFEKTGTSRNGGQHRVKALKSHICQFLNMYGFVAEEIHGQIMRSVFKVLNFNYYDEQTNVICFSSPYLDYLAERVMNESVRRDKDGRPELYSSGKPKLRPSHSYIIRSTICGERNKIAVENVNIIVTIIEQAGNGTPHVSAETIIDRNPLLKAKLDESGQNHKQQVLDRAFKKTWELLRTQTTLLETYKDIELPDPDEKKNLPRYGNLSQVFTFPHHGKKKNVPGQNV